MENQENIAPKISGRTEPTKTKFPVPKFTTASNEERLPLSPKKGVKVKSRYTPSYMKSTASSSKKNNVEPRITGTRSVNVRPSSARPASSRATGTYNARPASALAPSTRKPTVVPSKPEPKRPTVANTGKIRPSGDSKGIVAPKKMIKPIKPTSSAKVVTKTPSRWDRLATPKNSNRVQTTKTTQPKPILAKKNLKVTGPRKIEQKPPVKTIRTPASKIRPDITKQLGQKSCPQKDKKESRRRTRWSMSGPKGTPRAAAVKREKWNGLSKEDKKKQASIEAASFVSKFCADTLALKLPHFEKMALFQDVIEDNSLSNGIEFKLYSIYWKSYAEAAVNNGCTQESVLDIIQQGKKINAQPLELLNNWFDKYLEDIKKNPELIQGKAAKEPEVTILDDLDDDEILELSIVFAPDHDVQPEPAPVPEPGPLQSELDLLNEVTSGIKEVQLDDQSMLVRTLLEDNQQQKGSTFQLKVRKVGQDGKLVLTPIRCSARRRQILTPLKDKPEIGALVDAAELNDIIDETGALPQHITIIE